MKKIRIKYELSNTSENEIEDLTALLKRRYDVIIDNENPEYIICSVMNPECLKYDGIRILRLTELFYPDLNIYDYAFGFYLNDIDDRYCYVGPGGGVVSECQLRELINRERITSIMNDKDEFCGFVYSNASFYEPMRSELFKTLSSYKKVLSGGSLYNNVGGNVPDKIAFMKKCKFSIACENASEQGYITEKLYDSFLSRTIPIYYGDPGVARLFNEKAFINCHNYSSLDEVLEVVKEIDNNDEKYLEMLNQPVFVMDEYTRQKEKFEDFLYNIFEQDYEKAFRRNRHHYAKYYETYINTVLERNEKQKRLEEIKTRIYRLIYRRG